MLIAILNNIYTLISLVNGIRYQVINIISNKNNIFNFK